MRAHLAVLALLLAASAANAQVVKKLEERAQIMGSAPRMARLPLIHANGGGRKLLSDGATLNPTGGIDSTTLLSRNTKVCGATDTTQFEQLQSPNEQFGELLYDNAVCVTSTTRGKVTKSDASSAYYGASAQDFGATRTGWDTYGWALFATPSIPADVFDKDRIEIQGIQLHVIGNVGLGHTSTVNCSLSGVSIAIFNADQTAPFNPVSGTPVHSNTIPLPYNGVAAATGTFTWSSNSTAVIYTDVVADLQAVSRWQLLPNRLYWLRVKFIADYPGDASGSDTGKCLAFWAMSSGMNTATGSADFASLNTLTQGTGYRARWQETTGGSAGYSTTCLGASTSGDDAAGIPGEYQTFWNCWNNGIGVDQTATYRRCLTFRNMMTPSIPLADCTATNAGAQFNDFNYAFTGYMGTSGSGGSSP